MILMSELPRIPFNMPDTWIVKELDELKISPDVAVLFELLEGWKSLKHQF
jgi:hypothetical protein